MSKSMIVPEMYAYASQGRRTKKNGKPCQDVTKTAEGKRCAILVSDGAFKGEYSREGAETNVNIGSSIFTRKIDVVRNDAAVIKKLVARDLNEAILDKARELHTRPEQLAATFAAASVNSAGDLIAASIGDSTIVIRTLDEYRIVLSPKNKSGNKKRTYFTYNLDDARSTMGLYGVNVLREGITAVFIMTDGAADYLIGGGQKVIMSEFDKILMADDREQALMELCKTITSSEEHDDDAAVACMIFNKREAEMSSDSSYQTDEDSFQTYEYDMKADDEAGHIDIDIDDAWQKASEIISKRSSAQNASSASAAIQGAQERFKKVISRKLVQPEKRVPAEPQLDEENDIFEKATVIKPKHEVRAELTAQQIRDKVKSYNMPVGVGLYMAIRNNKS